MNVNWIKKYAKWNRRAHKSTFSVSFTLHKTGVGGKMKLFPSYRLLCKECVKSCLMKKSQKKGECRMLTRVPSGKLFSQHRVGDANLIKRIFARSLFFICFSNFWSRPMLAWRCRAFKRQTRKLSDIVMPFSWMNSRYRFANYRRRVKCIRS